MSQKMLRIYDQFRVSRALTLVAVCSGFAATQALAAPVVYQFSLTATSGSQFGVSAPATLTGTFTVDSSFLAQNDGNNYPGSNISGLYIIIGSQVYSAATATNPNIQGVSLQNHTIVGLAMNWSQTSAGLNGPYMQAAVDGTWEAGSTTNQDGTLILRGTAGSQAFTQLPPPTLAGPWPATGSHWSCRSNRPSGNCGRDRACRTARGKRPGWTSRISWAGRASRTNWPCGSTGLRSRFWRAAISSSGSSDAGQFHNDWHGQAECKPC